MTLIEIIRECAGRSKGDRAAFMMEMGVTTGTMATIQDSFTEEGQLIGGLGEKYKIILAPKPGR